MIGKGIDTGRKKSNGQPLYVEDPNDILDRHVVKRDSGCWEWTGALNGKGYGSTHCFGQRAAHRASWVRHNGPIPVGLVVCHRCDNPPCINPDHLFLGTHLDNTADMIAKGRQVRIWGERSGMAKVSDAQCEEMRARNAAGETQTSIAADYGIHSSQVSRIVRRISRAVPADLVGDSIAGEGDPIWDPYATPEQEETA